MEVFCCSSFSSCIYFSPSPSTPKYSPSSAKSHFSFLSSSCFNRNATPLFYHLPNSLSASASASSPSPPALHLPHDQEILEIQTSSVAALSPDMQVSLPKVDKTGRFCSPRAGRELALLTLYAACLEGSDPLRLFDRRVNARMESGYKFDKGMLVEYNHMNFGGPPVTSHTLEEAHELQLHDQKESDIEAEVLSAPPKLVYNKLILRFTRKVLVAVAERWNCHVHVIDTIVPDNWKIEPAGRILELSILHLAMSEIAILGTKPQIVINEAVDLAKRFCDGAAPRIINGCLRTFMKEFKVSAKTEDDLPRFRAPSPSQ